MEDAGRPSLSEGGIDLMEELLLSDHDYFDILLLLEHEQPTNIEDANSSQEEEALRQTTDTDMNWLRTPTPTPTLPLPLEDRLSRALGYIKHSSDVLIQMWVPIRLGPRQFLTTCGQPFRLDPASRSLASYRSVSLSYQFSAAEGSEELAGLPGRVFLGRAPEWTPDVRYFSSPEYLRLAHAQRCGVSGTVALPIFERDDVSRSCVGVVEVVSTLQNISYGSHVENICNALQAVDLTSSDVLNAPCTVKESNHSYHAALPEILSVLRVVCQTHGLPLAQTWIPCVQQGKRGSRHSEENERDCVSTVDAACFVNDASVLGFHEACSEHHLFKGQGLVGRAFTTNQPCFSPDITSFIKAKYPLSHHAKLFRLRAAVAIRLRSIHSGNADFVLEFFLPVDCTGSEEQKSVLNSLSVTIQQVCQSLRVVTAKELVDESELQPNESLPSDFVYDEYISEGRHMMTQEEEASGELPSSIPSEFSKQEIGEFSVTTSWDPPEESLLEERISSEVNQQLWQDVGKDTNDQREFSYSEPNFSNARKTTEGKRAKMEKTVSLQVLRQHFAGSLKDAAKRIGVCPTTLKRICRQHGITRWPSRKIKKVGHSLKKLQVVIDSVQGAEGTFQFSSLYENITKPFVPNKGSNISSRRKPTDHPESAKAPQQEEGTFYFHSSTSNSLSSSCKHSSCPRLGCSSGSKQGTHSPQGLLIKQKTPPIEAKHTTKVKRVHSNVELRFPNPGPPASLVRSISHDIFTEQHSLGNPSQQHKVTILLKVKASYEEEKVRFRLQPGWGFRELKQEIAKRFSISDSSSFDLKYLDDDSEWVLLTCDSDLHECIDVYKSSSSDTIRISAHRIAPSLTRASFHCPGLS
ncbi:uncharacterized protein M6B38_356750 [Iris pallida]|uniref:Uncharacterized protein n=1 Tax=Iris pallida TaxID=29817 RepID=A0AAX6GLT8_IRIPA|nr:uncharacterized protein M6B38_356750 [Iris pallida]